MQWGQIISKGALLSGVSLIVDKAEFMQEGIFFVLQLFAWRILLIKKLEIEKN